MRHPETDIMVVSVFGDEEHVLASIEAGATGYLLKDSLPEEFIDVIEQLRAGGSPISPVIARQLLRRLRPVQPLEPDLSDCRRLSARESEILGLIAKGFTFAELARLLEISPHTVTTYVKKIYQKLAVHSRGEAVYEASRRGLIS
jgi:DNA-binding NarL/FixJ family response regulator